MSYVYKRHVLRLECDGQSMWALGTTRQGRRREQRAMLAQASQFCSFFNSLLCGPMTHSCFYEVTVPMTQERYQIKGRRH